MKRTFLFTALVLAVALCPGFAQEPKMAIGLGPEFNMDSRENFAGGAALAFNYNLPVAAAPLTVGVTITGSYNFDGIFVGEPTALFRWYFLGGGHTGFFVQADLGAFLILEDGDLTPMFDGGLRAGYRIALGEMFYLEPYARGGYPFVFGVGVLAGLRF